jgi:hypothetical protein
MVFATIWFGPIHHMLFMFMLDLLEFLTGEPWAGVAGLM